MTDTVHCVVLDKDLPALPMAPYPGELGQRIHQEVSAEAWRLWLGHQTMLINEHRLSPINPEHRQLLEQEMRKFLFEGGAEKPDGYVPPDA